MEKKVYDWLSDCCNAPVNTEEGEEGTNHWVCSRCDNSCNAHCN